MGVEVSELVLPGLYDSGPDHWQSLWCDTRADCQRVELGQWDRPTPALWASRLDRAVARAARPLILIAHSLGCHAVAWWAAQTSAARLDKVRGALLVAPPDVERENAHELLKAFAPTPAQSLPFRSLLAASHDDRYASFERSAWMARIWGCSLIDVGYLGHINAESGLGEWPQGLALLEALESGCLPQPGTAARDLAGVRQTTERRH